MKIVLDKLGKKFVREWIIKDLSYTFESQSKTAITGSNGSGKSTLLSLISGIRPLTCGSIAFTKNDKVYPLEDSFKSISFAAPYQELIEEFTLRQLVKFHLRFRTLHKTEPVEQTADTLQLFNALDKPIRAYSSGMKQRVRLGLAMLTRADITMLDEPTTNLDNKGIDWYYKLVEKYSHRTIIVASNQEHEYNFCHERIVLPSRT